MNKHVLFLQGAGPGAHAEDGKLVASLRAGLGDGYALHYPAMPNADNPEYEPWKATIAQELAPLVGQIFLVGHSFGGSVVMKYLAEAPMHTPIAGVFLLAAPFWNGDDQDWQYDPFALPAGFAAQLSAIPHLFVYHSRDDAIVPFAHLGMYAAKLSQATVRAFDQRGHQFRNDLSELVEDIRNCDHGYIV